MDMCGICGIRVERIRISGIRIGGIRIAKLLMQTSEWIRIAMDTYWWDTC